MSHVEHLTILEDAMAFQAVPETVEIDLIFTQSGEIAQNVFYAKLIGGYTLTDLEDLAARIDLQWDGTWKARQTGETIYLRTEVRGLAVENDLFAENNDSTGPGTHVGIEMSNNVTFAVRKLSGLTGRSARGRTYWIGLPVSELLANDKNQLEPVYTALVVAAVDDIREAINGEGDWLPVLVSRFSGGVKREFGVTFPWNSSSNVDNRVDTQRRRLPAG